MISSPSLPRDVRAVNVRDDELSYHSVNDP